ncbi:MAG: copper-binding protein [Gammaproteobacteria bacterium]|nr:copper-binding protein [Gammaproteobacteria bacterium]MDH5802868.1 copper-binding protein [Gammaproteobacteria bacterium]
MKIVRSLGVLTLLVAAMGMASAAFAGDSHTVEGVIKKIKSGDKKLTISHGPIESMGMSGMTMDFKVFDPSMLDEVEEGHMVSFVIEQDKSGTFIIMEIEDKGVAKGAMSSDGHNHSH